MFYISLRPCKTLLHIQEVFVDSHIHDLQLLSQPHASERCHQTTGVGNAYTASIPFLHYMSLFCMNALQLPVCITGVDDSDP